MNGYLLKLLFLPSQSSTLAYDIDELHYFVILTTMAGATLVTLVGAYFVVRYRRRLPEPDPPNPDSATTPHYLLELGAVLGLAALFLVWWVIGARQFMQLRVAPTDSMIVYVTAKKWMWKFAYPEGARSIATLYVPAGRPVKLVMTSRDVIHSFFVPSFRIKQDVVPGRYTTAWFRAEKTGTYPILCAEYCGTDHSAMRGEVRVLEPADYARWLDDPSRDRSGEQDLVSRGRDVAVRRACVTCHSVGAGTSTTGPSWAGLYDSYVELRGGTRVLADEAYLTRSMMDPNADIVSGYQPVMPTYAGTLDASETAALVEYIESLREPQDPGVALPEVRAVGDTADAAVEADAAPATTTPDGGAR